MELQPLVDPGDSEVVVVVVDIGALPTELSAKPSSRWSSTRDPEWVDGTLGPTNRTVKRGARR